VELRYLRFAYVRGVGLLGERVLGPLRLKHFLYLFLAVLSLWRGLGGYPPALALAVALGVLTLASALYPPRSMSFESYLLALVMSLADLLAGRTVKGRAKPPEASGGPVKATEPATPGKGAVLAVVGLALAVAGGSMVLLGVLLRHPLVLVAGGLPLGLGLALVLGRALRR